MSILVLKAESFPSSGLNNIEPKACLVQKKEPPIEGFLQNKLILVCENKIEVEIKQIEQPMGQKKMELADALKMERGQIFAIPLGESSPGFSTKIFCMRNTNQAREKNPKINQLPVPTRLRKAPEFYCMIHLATVQQIEEKNVDQYENKCPQNFH